MRIVYYVAASADGMIARADGRVDWLDGRPPADYGFDAFGTIAWGRRTFDQAATLGGLGPYGTRRHVVLSRKPAPSALPPGVEYTSEPPAVLARRLRKSEPRDVWVMGGAELAGSFAQAGELDEVVVHVIPTLIGEGVPLLRGLERDLALRLRESHAFPDGVVRLAYEVLPPASTIK